ncbi:unnamed protein product [Ectocarpus sp. 4 AP-2014]
MAFEERTSDFYYVELAAYGGKFRGIFGATLKLASKHLGYRNPNGPAHIEYGSTEDTVSDIYMRFYFAEEKRRLDFINGVGKLHKIPKVLGKCALEHNPRVVVLKSTSHLLQESQLSPITNFELEAIYDRSPPGSIDYEYECEIQDIRSYTSSKKRRSPEAGASSISTSARSWERLSAITVLDVDNPICLYQQLEDPSRYAGDPYRLHLISKRYRPEEDPNNYLAGSWEFHQILDGLNFKSLGGVPGLVVEFDRVDGTWVSATDGIRHKVFVRIRFYNDAFRSQFSLNVLGRLKRESRGLLEDGTVETFVHVLNVNSFKRSLGIKIVDTQKEWDDLEAR